VADADIESISDNDALPLDLFLTLFGSPESKR